MVTYTCEKCFKTFRHKNDYNKHLNRKFRCFEKDDYVNPGIPGVSKGAVPVWEQNGTFDFSISSKNRDSIALSSDFDYLKSLPKAKLVENSHYHAGNKTGGAPSKNAKKSSENSVLHNTINDKFSKNKNETITYKCSYCGKQLKYRKTLNRHMKNCSLCPVTKSDISTIETVVEKKVQNKMKKNITNITNNTNNIHNTQNINNIIVIDGKEQLREFGKEDLAQISEDILNKAIHCPQLGILKLIKQIHFNKEIPQNQNINISNKKESFVEIFNGKEWEKQDKKIAIQNMITSKKDIMDDYVEEKTEKNLLSRFIKDNYEQFSEMLDKYVRESLNQYDDQIKTRIARNCQKLYLEIFKQAELILINNMKARKALEE